MGTGIKRFFAVSALIAPLALAGCASQSEVDQLRSELNKAQASAEAAKAEAAAAKAEAASAKADAAAATARAEAAENAAADSSRKADRIYNRSLRK